MAKFTKEEFINGLKENFNYLYYTIVKAKPAAV